MKKIILIITLFLLVINKNNLINKNKIEFFNKRIYTFNRSLDIFFFEKITEEYIKIIPDNLKENLNNFFSNIEEIQNTTFNLIEKKEYTNRIIINTILGIGGIYDIANFLNIKKKNINTNLKIIKNNNLKIFLILPIIGPNNIYNHINIIKYQIINPFLYQKKFLYLYYILYIINKKTHLIYNYNFFHKNLINGYSFLKNVFLQKILE